jgi:hypothetical protein
MYNTVTVIHPGDLFVRVTTVTTRFVVSIVDKNIFYVKINTYNKSIELCCLELENYRTLYGSLYKIQL